VSGVHGSGTVRAIHPDDERAMSDGATVPPIGRSAGRTTGGSVADRTVQLGRALQAAGVNVSLSEIIDAVRSVREIDLARRSELHTALRSTMVKQARHYAAFELAFDRFFPARITRGPDDAERGASAADDDVVRTLSTGDDLGAIAAALVDEYAGLDGDVRSEKHHVQRVFLGADIARLMSRVRIADPDMSPAMIRARVDELKRLIAQDVRGQLDRRLDLFDGVEGEEDLFDVGFLEASRAELDQMRDVIRPIARKLAARLAKRRQHRAGRVNMRRTMRRSLASGGVPIDVLHDRPRAHKPELFVVCDISGSVADFSLFTLTLMSALSAEIARTRSFVFVDDVDEVTELLASTGHGIEPWQLLRNTNAVGLDGHSDYGAVLERFWRDIGERELHRTSTVIVTGDARTNHKSSGEEWLGRIAERSRRVYWLNPEPRADWDTYDSEMSTYARHCSATWEVRNLRQLVAAVEHLF
jgi:uncharacterized protein with von Willebrand factor type A (vWA) domain